MAERCVSPETEKMEHTRQMLEYALSSELREEGENLTDIPSMGRISSYAREMEGIKSKAVSVSTSCQDLENDRATGNEDSKSDRDACNSSVIELQIQLREVLEKNKQWGEYDERREAYVSAIMGRMLWLEKQLNKANQAILKQHNEEHSDERKQRHQMQEYYDRLLQRAKEELEVSREQVNIANQCLKMTQNWCKERGLEIEELKQQLQTERMSRRSSPEDRHCFEDEAKQLTDKTKDLQSRLHEEKRRSATFELQVNLLQKFMLNHHADQEKITELERQLSRDSPTSSTSRSPVNESFLECPGCRIEYPASRHKELMDHLEICLD